MNNDIVVRPLMEHDLSAADRIFRLAFGTFLGLPDPMSFMGDADLVRTRWRASPDAALGAYVDGELVGSNFAASWGSLGYFGPLTVRPDFWDRGVARQLLTSTMELFERWGTRQRALFTFPHSPKHLALYQKFGLWPQHLTPVMSKPVAREGGTTRWSRFSEVPVNARSTCLANCRGLTHDVYSGLDLEREIRAVFEQGIGDAVLIHEGADVAALGIVHVGPGSEAGSGSAYVKFGAARPGRDDARHFDDLLSACEAFAESRGVAQCVIGVNAGCHGAYRALLERGFRTVFSGVAMLDPNDSAYNRSDRYVVGDWR